MKTEGSGPAWRDIGRSTQADGMAQDDKKDMH